MGAATAAGPTRPPDASVTARTSTSSTRVFQPSQVGQRPLHLGDAAPHSVHRWTVFTFAMP